MGYYADLIKQKQEKRNSAESHLKGLIGKKFKRDTDLERAVNSSIYTEISDWSHPRMVVFDKYTDEKYILTTEDNNQYGKDKEFWISKVQKANSKEEKDNESTVEKFDHYGSKIEIIKTDSGNFRYRVSKKGKFKESMSVSTRSEAMRDAIKDAETWANEKEEGYYAKLAEEKAERNNDKTISLYGKNYSFGSDRQKNQQEFKKAQDDFNREYFKVKEEMDELQKELRSKRFKLDQQWNTFYSQVKGFLGL